MNDEFEVSFIHTESCSVCKGSHIEYRNRQCCKNYQSLCDVMIKRELLILPSGIVKAERAIPDMGKIISGMRSAGASRMEMAKATGLSENNVSGYIYKANKVKQATGLYKKCGDDI